MNYVEYGKENSDVIILLHGGGLSWWNYKDTCAIRKSDMIAFLQENSVYSLKDGIGECEARSIYYDLFRFR